MRQRATNIPPCLDSQLKGFLLFLFLSFFTFLSLFSKAGKALNSSGTDSCRGGENQSSIHAKEIEDFRPIFLSCLKGSDKGVEIEEWRMKKAMEKMDGNRY